MLDHYFASAASHGLAMVPASEGETFHIENRNTV
jgi:hypothetical protein